MDETDLVGIALDAQKRGTSKGWIRAIRVPLDILDTGLLESLQIPVDNGFCRVQREQISQNIVSYEISNDLGILGTIRLVRWQNYTDVEYSVRNERRKFKFFVELLKGWLQTLNQALATEKALQQELAPKRRQNENDAPRQDDLTERINSSFPKPVTKKRRDRLARLVELYWQSGHLLTQEQIAERFTVSVDTVRDDLKLLRENGFIETSR